MKLNAKMVEQMVDDGASLGPKIKFGASEGEPAKRHKYRAQATVVNGIRFSSRREAVRYTELKLLERRGKIGGLKLQPRFPLLVGDVKIGSYVADFEYMDRGVRVIEDVKGMRLPLYKWKKKHFEAQYGLSITEV